MTSLLQLLSLASSLPSTPEEIVHVDDSLRAQARTLDADQLATLLEVALLLQDTYARIVEIARIEAARRRLAVS